MKPLLFNLLFEINSDSSGLPLGNRLKLILGLKPRTTSDRSAIRLVNSMHAWIPGIQRGKNVRVSTTVGIKFDLK